MIRLDLWKCLWKKVSFELGFRSERAGRFRKLADSEFQTVGATSYDTGSQWSFFKTGVTWS